MSHRRRRWGALLLSAGWEAAEHLPGDNHLGEEYPFAKHFDVIA